MRKLPYWSLPSLVRKRRKSLRDIELLGGVISDAESGEKDSSQRKPARWSDRLGGRET